MRGLFCPIVSKAPVIDGKLDEGEWGGAFATSSFLGKRDRPVTDTLARLCADPDFLYFGFVCAGPDHAPKTRGLTGRDVLERKDDAVGVLLDLDHGHESSYFFLVAGDGSPLDALKTEPASGGWGDRSWNADWKLAVSQGPDAWSAEFAIPIRKIGGEAVHAGRTIGVNLVRERPQLLESCHWVSGGGGKRTPFFADMIFGPPGPRLASISAPSWRQGGNAVKVTFANDGMAAASLVAKATIASEEGLRAWQPAAFELAPGETRELSLEGPVVGDWKQRLELRLETGGGAPVYRASYPLKPSPSVEWETFTADLRTSGVLCFPGDDVLIDLETRTGLEEGASPNPGVRLFSLSNRRWIVRAPGVVPVSTHTLQMSIPTTGLAPGVYRLFLDLDEVAQPEGALAAHEFLLLPEKWSFLKSLGARVREALPLADKEAGERRFGASSGLLLQWLVEEGERQVLQSGVADYEKRLGEARRLWETADGLEEAFKDGLDPLQDRKGLIRRALLCPSDGQIHPYTVYVPESYVPAKPASFVTDLLAFLPEPAWSNLRGDSTDFPWPQVLRSLESHGIIMAWPPPVRALGGERNYFALLEQMKADYAIDTDRLYLLGVSGGGLSSWLIALRHPDLIAAIAPISGVTQADGRVEAHSPGGGSGSDEIDEARSAFYFPMNAQYTPVIMLHGDADPVTPIETQARPIYRKMRELGLDVDLVEYPGADHGLGEDYPVAFDRALEFFSRRRKERHARSIDFTTYDVRYNKAYWIRVEVFEAPGRPARIKARLADSSLEVEATNVLRWSLAPDPDLFHLAIPLNVGVNGQPPLRVSLREGGIYTFAKRPDGSWIVEDEQPVPEPR